MIRRGRGAVLALALASLLIQGAADKPKDMGLPPYAAAYEPQGRDERGLWMQADESERELRDSKFLIDDPALKAYVGGVLCRTVGQDRCKGVRIYLVRVAAFNASMMPNGAMQVWSGLLLRVRSEAELAGVLGHEFAHFELRHSLADFRHVRSATDTAIISALFGVYGLAMTQGAISSIYRFSREQETQADLLSLRYLKASPYSAQAFAHVWERLMDEADASALGRKQKSHRYDKTPFFATHPTDLDRATYLRDLAKDSPAQPENEADYHVALAPAMPGFLADQLRLNDFEGTEYLLGQLGGPDWTGDLLYARAELYRLRGHPRDLVSAADFYRAAIEKQPDYVEAYRGLGLALLRSQQREPGKVALAHYLSLQPTARDAAMLRSLIAEQGDKQ